MMEKRGRTIGHIRPFFGRTGTALLTASVLFVLLALWLTVGVHQAWADEGEARPTPTPAIMLVLRPDTGMPHTSVQAEGHGFPAGSRVTLTWDEDTTLAKKVLVAGNGSFVTQFEVPEGSRGHYVVRATADDSQKTFAEAVFRLIIPTRTPTPTPSITPTPEWTATPTWTPWPTNTHVPTNTPWPTNTPLPSATWTRSPTLRPVTPIYPTSTPYVRPPTPTPYFPPPTPTPYVSPTATAIVPLPTPPLPSPTLGFVTPVPTGTVSPTVFVTTVTPLATPTLVPTGTVSPTVFVTAVTPLATPTPRPTPAGGLSPTGGGGPLLLWGGALFLVVAMVGARWLRSVPLV